MDRLMCVCVGSEVKAATFVRTDRCESPFNFKLHPRLLFFPFIKHLLLCLSCVFLLPTASLVHSQHTPQRGRLMRANDRKACCCFPFINRCTLAPNTFHQASAVSAGSSFPFIYHLPAPSLTLHLFHCSYRAAFVHFLLSCTFSASYWSFTHHHNHCYALFCEH